MHGRHKEQQNGHRPHRAGNLVEMSLLVERDEDRVETKTIALPEPAGSTPQGERPASKIDSVLVAQNTRLARQMTTVGHELRSPLATLATVIDLIDHQPVDGRTLGRLLGTMRRQVSQMLHLVDDFMGIEPCSGAERSTDPVERRRRSLDMAHLVAQAIGDHSHGFERARLDLRLDLPSEPLWVRGDPVRLLQAIENLLGNARRFSNPGDQVTVRLLPEAGGMRLEVSDTGQGIAPEDLESIFRPTVRGQGVRERRTPGLGLGLTIVRNIVESHGGWVQASSLGPGLGATFTVRLPSERSWERSWGMA